MIDLNCKILPGTGDGPESMQGSLAMAQKASDQGVETIVAAPRFQFERGPREVKLQCEELNKELFDQGIEVRILPGHEVKIYGELVDDLKNGHIIPMNEKTPYIYVVFSNKDIPHYAKQVLYDMQLEGYIPVIVHPEQNQVFQQQPDLLYQFVKNGAVTQVSAASLANKQGKPSQKLALQMIRHNLAHVVASHAVDDKKKGFFLRQAYDKIQKSFGSDVMYQFMENAHVLLDGEMVYTDPPERIKTKKTLGIFPFQS
ncbi:tyrosine-protein phosphatase [Halobacillus litoralis]|uniref:tyrosine-protein phosphatase n=1 Tax=Halobacillus litoralis TaxID=45668 RepID=UPI001CD19A4E|nr:CpsB/CapC family capsule biosynthesis tyrosine phosphatase [Halobacillus litoralis]MCA1021155.1 tyrosine protein phosphatase [Halobacillus litoralis]